MNKISFKTLHDYVQSLEEQPSEDIKNAVGVTKAADDSIGGKKRKNAEQASRGVEKLKKANITGMAKISTFFKKPVQAMA